MPEKDLLVIARRAANELLLWFVMSSISLGISSSIVSDAVKELMACSTLQQVLPSALLIAFSAVWFLLSLTLMRNIWLIERKHGFFLAIRFWRRELSPESIADFVKDTVSLYRGYRWLIVSVGAIALVVGIAMVAYSTYSYVTGSAEVGEFLFRLFIGAVTLSYAASNLYAEEVLMARKLARVKSAEDRLSEFLR